MRRSIAATVTLDDLKTYFKGAHWRSVVRDDGVFEGRSNSYFVELAPGGTPSFFVKIHSYEDDADSDESVTDEPMKFLVDFLKTGSVGDEALQKMAGVFRKMASLPPVGMANLLRSLADDVERERIGPRALARVLRHASLMPDLPGPVKILSTMVQAASREETETKEMQDLANKMTEKGWRVKSGKGEGGLPQLTVDIAGIYEALIEVDHIPWKFSYEVHDHPDTKVTGITDDPIAEFRQYYQSDSVQTAKSDLRAGEKDRAEKAIDKGTVAPSKR